MTFYLDRAMDTNYFVCTLGEAANSAGGQHYRDVNHLIAAQSKTNPELPAIGFYRVGTSHDETRVSCEVLTFKGIYQGVLVTAGLLSQSLDVPKAGTVGLLSSSSPEFFFTWLALIWLGHPVLLIAPECSASAVAQLCHGCDTTTLITDEKNEDLGVQAAKKQVDGSSTRLRCLKQPFTGHDVFDKIKGESGNVGPAAAPKDTDTAYLHHTSGTSSGTPKPIPQSHRGAVGALPTLEGDDQATFTTTPLFHGAPADIFRAWTSNTMIWLFPSKDVPITAKNIVKCLRSSTDAVEENAYPPVSFFASVPYILQMMAVDKEALQCLQKMKLVSVGGAALPPEVGNELVDKGVNLVSRFGSAECGFLMSSHREYSKDRDWQYLRSPKGPPVLRFEEREGGVSELVVPPDWPHMAKHNREDGSYASSDLFEPHPHIENAWRYHSRADAQLTLLTGKKFDPAPIESGIVAATALLSDALVFGTGRIYPGVLLFRSEEGASLTDADVVQSVEPCLQRINAEGHSHARIPRSMLIPMPYSDNPLEKSSKGTILRNNANTRYAKAIEKAYEVQEQQVDEACSDEELPRVIKEIILGSVPDKTSLFDTTDLFSFGVDSVASIRIRHKLQQLIPQIADRLSVSIVEECGTVQNLAEYILSIRQGRNSRLEPQADDQHRYMLQLVEQYSHVIDSPAETVGQNSAIHRPGEKEVVVLTGATGALGTHVLDQLRRHEAVHKIYCLVRGSDVHAATERINKALRERELSCLDASSSGKVVVLQAKLRDSKLGLEDRIYRQMALEATIIMHLAWSVNFRMKLRSFVRDSISSVQNLMNLALASPQKTCPRFAFCSSVASVMAHSQSPVPETIIDSPSSATDLGYSQSKWVAEHICHKMSQDTRLSGRVSVFRLGQLSGDRKTGVWNSTEAWPLLLSTVGVTGTLPDLPDEIIDWLPVDIAATAMIEGAMCAPASDEMRLFHVVNDSLSASWSELLRWLSKRVSFEIVSPTQWIQQLDNVAEKGSSHPALGLLDHWKKAFSGEDASKQEKQSRISFDMTGTKQAISALRNVEPVEEGYLIKLWSWIEASMLGKGSKTCAYSTLLTRASYLAGVIVLAHTLRKHGSGHPLIVFYTAGLSDVALQALRAEAQQLKLILQPCEPLLPPQHVQVNLIAQRFADTWTKLRVFQIFDYDVVCYLDADTAVFNQNMDDIFSCVEDLSLDNIAANHVCCCNLDDDPWAPQDWRKENCPYTPLSHPSALSNPTPVRAESRPTHHLLNGGMFLYRPRKELWDQMLAYFNTSDQLGTYMFPDQDFLADFFRGRWRSLGWQWNALKTMRYWHPDMWRDAEVRCLHYIVDKPWAARIPVEGPKSGVGGYKGLDGETHQWWWNEYNEWAAVRRADGRGDLIKIVEQYIAPEPGTEQGDPDMKDIAPPESA
ncbi:hypothetical protein LTR37_002529 [Vermiconidia calcicola]|uniref:Uncharacterized protein n=1 Tax=Vermiconidia calcicola TaxID=1690605 RepID=A0ACC3NVR4_9PEZI|nr:hypothetical protein LTR37_002529 [Vermiconidia calcicola]